MNYIENWFKLFKYKGDRHKQNISKLLQIPINFSFTFDLQFLLSKFRAFLGNSREPGGQDKTVVKSMRLPISPIYILRITTELWGISVFSPADDALILHNDYIALLFGVICFPSLRGFEKGLSCKRRLAVENVRLPGALGGFETCIFDLPLYVDHADVYKQAIHVPDFTPKYS